MTDIQIRKILHPTDFSDLSLHAMRYAEFLARSLSAELHCLTVADAIYDFPAMPEIEVVPVAPLPAEVKANAEKGMAFFMEKHAPDDLSVTSVVRLGQPFMEIIRYAREEKMNLIVMGTHGRSALTHMLMGSVAEKVVRKSCCPVLTVRPPGHGFEMP